MTLPSSWLWRLMFNLKHIRQQSFWTNFTQFRTTGYLNFSTTPPVGTDKFGNIYYEDPTMVYGQHRWVRPADPNMDASDIPPEWHAWLHRFVEEPPNKSNVKPPFYLADYVGNQTGTPNRYYPPGSYEVATGGRWRGSRVESWTPGTETLATEIKRQQIGSRSEN